MSLGKIVVVSAPSGAGKTTLLDHVRQVIPSLVYSVSATTRSPRASEIHGKQYYFLTREEFESKIAANAFAEWQQVHGNYYGTPKQYVLDTIENGKHLLMDIDVYGKKKFDACFPQAQGLLIMAPSMEELERRLRGRNTEQEETIRLRLTNARGEVDFARNQGKYEFTLINDTLEKAKTDIVNLVHTILGT